MPVRKSNIPLDLKPAYEKTPQLPRDEWSSGAIRSPLSHPNMGKIKPRKFDDKICKHCGGTGVREVELIKKGRAKRYIACDHRS
jgi:hypothetical protein